MRAELEDRFGPLPREATHLLNVVTLRSAARVLRVERLDVRKSRATIAFARGTPVTAERLLAMLRARGSRFRLVRDFVVEVGLPGGSWDEIVAALLARLKEFQ
jgi:transcription-repair coupling factor (superfamily II helicase)